jgi:HAD superfamily hydrolase (TIGR01662 family)
LWEAWNLGGAFLGRELFPDVLPTLQWLREAGYRLGAVTNRGYSGPRFHEEMEDLGLADLFETTAISCDFGYMKPHPRIFQYALEQMGAEAAEAVMVGDSLRADVEGAKTLGMTAIWRRPVTGEPLEATEDEPEPGPIAPDYTIDDIGELTTLPLFSGAAAPK